MTDDDKRIVKEMVCWFTKEVRQCNNSFLRQEAFRRGGYNTEDIIDAVKIRLKKSKIAKSSRQGGQWMLVRIYGDEA